MRKFIPFVVAVMAVSFAATPVLGGLRDLAKSAIKTGVDKAKEKGLDKKAMDVAKGAVQKKMGNK